MVTDKIKPRNSHRMEMQVGDLLVCSLVYGHSRLSFSTDYFAEEDEEG